MHGAGDRGRGVWLLVAAGCWPTLMAFIISSSVWYILDEEPASAIGEVSRERDEITQGNLFDIIHEGFSDIFCTQRIAWQQNGFCKSAIFCIDMWCCHFFLL